MANPLVEGITLLNAARGLLHEIKGIPAAIRGASGNQGNKIGSNDFAAALREAYAAGVAQSKQSAPASNTSAPQSNPLAQASQVQAKLAQFASEIGKLFKQEGVDTEVNEVVLQMDSTGKVVVANDHPQKTLIESAFQLFPALTLGFRQLSLNAAATQSAQQNLLYRQAYMLNPASVPDGFSTINPADFEIVVGPDGIQWGFGEGTSTESTDSGTDNSTA
ncbi:MAG: hypothetical protein AMXMBFR84_18960 [Candidatus Hydrogenedentota bacterium]